MPRTRNASGLCLLTQLLRSSSCDWVVVNKQDDWCRYEWSDILHHTQHLDVTQIAVLCTSSTQMPWLSVSINQNQLFQGMLAIIRIGTSLQVHEETVYSITEYSSTQDRC